MSTSIQDIPEGEHLERIRREILDNVERRRQEANNALSDLTKYLGIVCSGGTIAILSFIATKKASGAAVPSFAIVSFLFFALSILSFATLLYRHFQLHSIR
jgi:hypothetical protein